MKVLVCGGRRFRDRGLLHTRLDALHQARPISCVISGAQRYYHVREFIGADWLAIEWALRRQLPFMGYPAQWGVFGPSAGFKRNTVMVELRPDLVVAFAGGSGTADTVAKARKAGIEVMEVA